MQPRSAQAYHLMKIAGFILAALLLGPLVPGAHAQSPSPEGLWKTVSDKTGDATSFVKIWLENGKLFGKVERLIRKPGQDPDPVCKECQGVKKNQPVKGMTILWGLTQNGDKWRGGYIMDPDNGKTYRTIVKVVDKGKKLHVRGYIGYSLLGRTQVWHRAD